MSEPESTTEGRNHEARPRPRLTVILDDEGMVDRDAVAGLLARDPHTFTLSEICAMRDLLQDLPSGLICTRGRLDEFMQVSAVRSRAKVSATTRPASGV